MRKGEEIEREIKNNSRLNWVQEEENHLKRLHLEEGIKSWKEIAARMNSEFPSRNRTPKQYRERFTNYIRFEGQKLERGLWTQEQDAKIFQKYMQMGSKWVEISKAVSGRSENNVKNRFYSTMRKLIRRINLALSQNKRDHNIRKPLKQVSIFKLLQSQNIPENPRASFDFSEESKQSFIMKLKFQVLKLANQLNSNIEMPQLVQMGVQLHKFNTLTRFESLKKSRKGQLAKRKALPPLIRDNVEINSLSMQRESEKSSVEDGNSDKKSKQTYESESVMRNQFLQQVPVGNMDFFDDMNSMEKDRSMSKDLDYEISLILGIKYEPQQFYFL